MDVPGILDKHSERQDKMNKCEKLPIFPCLLLLELISLIVGLILKLKIEGKKQGGNMISTTHLPTAAYLPLQLTK